MIVILIRLKPIYLKQLTLEKFLEKLVKLYCNKLNNLNNLNDYMLVLLRKNQHVVLNIIETECEKTMSIIDYYDNSSLIPIEDSIDTDLSQKSYDEKKLEIFDDILNNTVGEDLQRLIHIQSKYSSIGNKIVANKASEVFFNKLFTASCPKILKYNITEQQLYQLHIFAVQLCRYNDQVLHLEKPIFIKNIYIPNMMNACATYLVNARRLIQKLVRESYKEIDNKCKDMIDIYVDRYKSNTDFIKNEAIYLFLRNIMLQFDPLEIKDLEHFYSTTMTRIFFYYIKSKTSDISTSDSDKFYANSSSLNGPSERYRIYEEALYLSQIRSMCDESNEVNQISKRYERLKNIIIPNEIQKLFLFSLNKGYYITSDKKLALIETLNNEDNIKFMKKQTPIIYRVLRSIHVTSDKHTFLPTDVILIRTVIYTTLKRKFKHVLNTNVIDTILTRITDNLVNSLTTGEFIDMLTMTSIKISGNRFASQLEVFLDKVLTDVGLESSD